MFENEPYDGFPPERPLPTEGRIAWEELHVRVVDRLTDCERAARVRAAIRATTCHALYLAITHDDRQGTVKLHGGLCVGVEGEPRLREISISPDAIASALNAVGDESRAAIAALVTWARLYAEYDARWRNDDGHTGVRTTVVTPDDDMDDEEDGIHLSEEEETDGEGRDEWSGVTEDEPDDFPWKDGMGSDDESWRGDVHLAPDDDGGDCAEEDMLDPTLVQAILQDMPDIEEHHRAIVEGRIQPEDLLRKIAG